MMADRLGDGPLEVAVVGVGRMGRHHARIYSRLPRTKLVAVVDRNVERAEEVADEYGCRHYAGVEELLAAHPTLGAVTVAVPTTGHRPAAEPLLRRGVACLVEKPLALSVEEARRLVEVAEEHGATLAVGHTERFNRAVMAVMAMEIPARFIEVQRISPMTFRSLDVSVVMDMMIHDLDIVLTLAGDKPVRIDAAGVSVMGEHADIANARLVFPSGCVANVTASRLATKTERKLRLFSEQGYVSLDYQRGDGLVIRAADHALLLDEIRSRLAEGADLSSLDYSELLKIDRLTMGEEASDALTAELRSFLDAVRTGTKPAVDGRAGCDAIEVAQQVIAAINAHRWEGLSPTPI